MLTTEIVDRSVEQARLVRAKFPAGGLFADQEWRTSPEPFFLEPAALKEIEQLGRVFLQFYRAVNLLYRQSVAGKQPEWVATYLDQGKSASLLDLQRTASFKNEVPRVIRPDMLLTEDGFSISELDSVPGGIGLTAWLNQTYSSLAPDNGGSIVGGPDGMLRGFRNIFNRAPRVHIVVSDESAGYRPEMKWLVEQMPVEDGQTFAVRDTSFRDFQKGDAVYRFFELFDAPNLPSSELIFNLAREGVISLTPPPKPIFEEKMLFGLLWNRNLREFWRQELGESFLQRLLKTVPYTWIVDPAPLPHHAAFPGLDLTNWQQLKALSQRERNLILKISGFSPQAWGARGVYLGSDLSAVEWSEAVDRAVTNFSRSPYVLQRYQKSRVVDSQYLDFATGKMTSMPGRVRLCPYYFVVGEGDAARTELGGILATICPADKKILHGMKDAILAPCAVLQR